MLKKKLQIVQPVEPAAAAGGQPTAIEANTDGQRNVRDNTTDGQTGTRTLLRNPVVERAGGAAPRPDVSHARPVDVSLDQKATTIATNSVESGFGGLRSVARHQAEQADVKLPIETMRIFCKHNR